MALEESKSDDDELIEAGGLKFLIINNQKFYFENMTLDFVKNMFGMGEYTLVRPK